MAGIVSYSGHLATALRLKLGSTYPDILETAFGLAVMHGGLKELDFIRVEGSSYNPRPARIGLILLGDTGITDSTTLAAGFLAASEYPQRFSEPTNEIPANIHQLCQLSVAAPQVLLGEHNDNTAAISIALSLHLDRARHRHQASEPSILSQNTAFLKTTEEYLELARSSGNPLERLLRHWYERFGSKILESRRQMNRES